jgi:hypothetical protein
MGLCASRRSSRIAMILPARIFRRLDARNDHFEPRAMELFSVDPAGQGDAFVRRRQHPRHRCCRYAQCPAQTRHALSQALAEPADGLEALGGKAFAGFGTPQQEEGEFVPERCLIGPGFAHQVPPAVRQLVEVELVESVGRRDDVGKSVEKRLSLALDDRQEQSLLAAEMGIGGSPRVPGRIGDVLQRGATESPCARTPPRLRPAGGCGCARGVSPGFSVAPSGHPPRSMEAKGVAGIYIYARGMQTCISFASQGKGLWPL